MSSPVDSITDAMASTTISRWRGRGGGRGRGGRRGRGGGRHNGQQYQYECRATQLQPAWKLLRDGEPVALDIEFQNYRQAGLKRHRVGRIGIVNIRGETVLDVYAAYRYEDGVEKFLPPPYLDLGVKWADLKHENGAQPAYMVEDWVRTIVNGRTVIVHDFRQDKHAFYLLNDVFSRSKICDTQLLYSYLQQDRRPSLRTTTSRILGRTIQSGDHSPVEDAKATMDLWLVVCDWDAKTKKIVDRPDAVERREAHGKAVMARVKREEEEYEAYVASLPACEGCGERQWCNCTGADGSEETATPEEVEPVEDYRVQADKDGW